MPQPDRRELDQGYGVGREFVEVRRDASTLFDPIAEPFDQVAQIPSSQFWTLNHGRGGGARFTRAPVFGYLANAGRAHFVVALGT